MSVLAGPIFAVATVLGVAGVLKLARPEATVAALGTARLPGSALAVRALAVTEIAVAAAALAFGTALTAALLAIYYAGFAAFTWLLLHRAGTAASCGCFGETEAPTPTTWFHVAMNLVAAVLALSAVIWPTGGLLDVLAEQPLAGIPFLVLTGLCAWLWYLGLTVVPTLVTGTPRETASLT